MIVFTITNKATGTVYVGTTRNDLVLQWDKIVAAAEQQLDFPLYREIRAQGAENFTLEEWDYTDDRQELVELEREALRTLGAESLRGYKTAAVASKAVESKKPPRKTAIRTSIKKGASATVNDIDNSQPLKHVNTSGESVVRFDRKTSTVAEAMSDIGNRTPEHTYIHPLRRLSSTTTEETEATTDTAQPETDTLVDNTLTTNNSNVLEDALTLLKQLQQAESDQPGASAQAESIATTQAEAVVAEQSPEVTAYQLRINAAIERQRQQLKNRCSEQQKQQQRKTTERINALELLAQQKMGRLSSAA